MCLILLAHRVDPEHPLVLGANRDEFHDRPTAAAAPWPEDASVLGGRDLRGGGTWLAVTAAGRWAALTNYRDPAAERPDAPTRGRLVSDFVLGSSDPAEYVSAVAASGERYNGFNLLAGDARGMWWYSNRNGPPVRLEPGIYGISNHLLNTPWPKVERGRAALEEILSERPIDDAVLLDRLLDRTIAADDELPSTGVERALERALSAMFIEVPGYGTRSSTALLIGADGEAHFTERTHDPERPQAEERRYASAGASRWIRVRGDWGRAPGT